MRFLPLAGSLALLLTACSHQPTPAPEHQAGDITPATSQETRAPAGVALLRGTLSWQGGETRFSPCGSQQQWQLLADGSLTQAWQAMGQPESAYVELYGNLTLGDSRDSPLRLTSKRLNRLSAANLPQSCTETAADSRLILAGEQPAPWAFRLSGNSGVFTSDGLSRTLQLKEQQGQTTGAQQMTLMATDGQQATLVLTPGLCTTDGGQQAWGWQASLSLEGGEPAYQGCARQGHLLAQLQPPLQWRGHWELMRADLALTLTPHYESTLLLVRQQGPQVLYEGAWQPTADGLTVLFNRRNDMGVREAIPFRLQSNHLTADYRLLNGGQVDFDSPLSLVPGTLGSVTPKPAAADTPTAAPLPPSLSAASTADPQVEQALRDYFVMSRSDPHQASYRYGLLDLNGDGRPEALVQMNWCSGGQCVWLIFQGQSQGYRFAARIEALAAPFYVASHTQRGWHDLLAPGSAGSWVQLSHDGISYPVRTQGAPLAPASLLEGATQVSFGQGAWRHLP
ncbi:hypothetical protein ABHF91_00755 [Pseudaeromonas sp. ZJS20]|uniref:hypothetical protein n=1 Tax=Pseudaeromonas aegiceratis TaxID=3153928 RepID=UPI00390C7CA0